LTQFQKQESQKLGNALLQCGQTSRDCRTNWIYHDKLPNFAQANLDSDTLQQLELTKFSPKKRIELVVNLISFNEHWSDEFVQWVKCQKRPLEVVPAFTGLSPDQSKEFTLKLLARDKIHLAGSINNTKLPGLQLAELDIQTLQRLDLTKLWQETRTELVVGVVFPKNSDQRNYRN
jgi:hypothetical protein